MILCCSISMPVKAYSHSPIQKKFRKWTKTTILQKLFLIKNKYYSSKKKSLKINKYEREKERSKLSTHFLVTSVVLACPFNYTRLLPGRKGEVTDFCIQKHKYTMFFYFTHKCLQWCRERMTREGLSLIAGIVPVDSLNTMPSQNLRKIKYVKEKIRKPRESLCKY